MTYRSFVLGAASLAAGLLVSGHAMAQSMTQPMSAPPMSTAPAPAQPAAPAPTIANDCSGIQKTLAERKALVSRANSASTSKKKLTPAEACSLFGRLVSNGNEGLKWITANREWCSIPDSFAEGFKTDHAKVSTIRSQICGVAAKAAKMEAQARTQAENGSGGGLLGGPGLSGSFKLPQGAL